MMRGIIGTLLLIFIFCEIRAQAVAVDFLTAEIDVHPHTETRSIKGFVTYSFVSQPGADSLRLDARNMAFQQVHLNERPVPYSYNKEVLSIPAPAKGGTHRLGIRYHCRPKQTVYFIGWEDDMEGNEQVWTQGQGKYSSHWVPSFDDMREKVVFNLRIRANPKYTAIANGRLTGTKMEDGYRVWSFRMQKPMSSYLLAFAMGEFAHVTERSASGVPLEWYYPKGVEARAGVTFRYSQEIFDYLEKEIGYGYPWQDYKQVPVSDFMYAGMENTGATFFSEDYVTDSLGVADRPYMGIDAHELAHQWFGNLVTEEDGASHWLHEGFAQYYAYLAQEHILGKEAVLWMLLDTARQLHALDTKEEGTALTNPGSSSLIFYEKGAWALYALRDEMGTDRFRRGIQQYLNTYAFDNASITDFLELMEEDSGMSLTGFRDTWLEASTFPNAWAVDFLSRESPAIRYFLELLNDGLPEGGIPEAWAAFRNIKYRMALIGAFGTSFTQADYVRAFEETDTGIRKALLGSIGTLPPWSLDWARSLLDAPSYELREQALFALWMADGDRRRQVLEHTEGNGSFGSLKFRQLWWMLAVFTEDFGTEAEKQGFLASLRGTTSLGHPVDVRMNAFGILRETGGLALRNYRDLIGATEHHNWQFRLYARRTFDALLEENPDQAFWKGVLAEFPTGELPYVERMLETP